MCCYSSLFGNVTTFGQHSSLRPGFSVPPTRSLAAALSHGLSLSLGREMDTDRMRGSTDCLREVLEISPPRRGQGAPSVPALREVLETLDA